MSLGQQVYVPSVNGNIPSPVVLAYCTTVIATRLRALPQPVPIPLPAEAGSPSEALMAVERLIEFIILEVGLLMSIALMFLTDRLRLRRRMRWR